MLPSNELIKKLLNNQNQLYINAITLVLQRLDIETYLTILGYYLNQQPGMRDKIKQIAKATIYFIEKLEEAGKNGENQQSSERQNETRTNG